jgi:hypothetical protein
MCCRVSYTSKNIYHAGDAEFAENKKHITALASSCVLCALE